MNPINIMCGNNKSITLVEDGEIPFGPRLYSLHINAINHALVKCVFLERFSISDDGRYIALTEYIRKDKQHYYTQLIIVDVTAMKFALLKKVDGVVIPRSLSEVVVYEEEKSGVKREFEYPVSSITTWQLLQIIGDDTQRNYSYSEIFKQYGYALEMYAHNAFQLRIRYTRNAIRSLLLLSIVDLVFLTLAVFTDDVFRKVAAVIGVILLFAVMYAVLLPHFFKLEVKEGIIQKRFFIRQIFTRDDVEKYVVQNEIILKPRSSQVESYTWYLLLQLKNGKKVNLIHFNHRDQNKGLEDLKTVLELFLQHINVEVFYITKHH